MDRQPVGCIYCKCVKERIGGAITYFIGDTVYNKAPICNRKSKSLTITEEFMNDKHCICFTSPNNLKVCALVDSSNPSDFFDYLFDRKITPEIKPLEEYQDHIKMQPIFSKDQKDNLEVVKSAFLITDRVMPIHIDDEGFTPNDLDLILL